MMRAFFVGFLLLALAAAGCGEAEPMEVTEDVWPGFSRAATNAFPTADEIEFACRQAIERFKQEAERTPGTYIDLIYAEYPVRDVQCRWEAEAAATALCTFRDTEVPFGADREQVLRRSTSSDWKDSSARFVHVSGPIHRGTGWIAPAGCQVLPPSPS